MRGGSETEWEELDKLIDVDDVSLFQMASSSRVARKYDQRARQTRFDTVADRQKSPIWQVKQVNNWMKSVLIQKYGRGAHTVFDWACGKGGDLGKWKFVASVREYQGWDISADSIQNLQDRLQVLRPRFSVRAQVQDLSQPFDPPVSSADVVTMFFALHYFFSDPQTRDRLFHSVAKALKPGGMFFGIVTHGDRVQTMQKELVTIVMESPTAYTFTLKDAVDGITEYVTRPEDLRKAVTAIPGLKWVYGAPAEKFMRQHQHQPMYRDLYRKMVGSAPLTPATQDVVKLYYVFCVQKA